VFECEPDGSKALATTTTKQSCVDSANSIHTPNRNSCKELQAFLRRSRKERASRYGLYRPTIFLGGDYCETCALQEMYCACEFTPQAGTAEASVFQASSNLTVQNIKFSDQKITNDYAIESSTDPTRTLQDGNALSLNDFFSRPVIAAREEWVTGGIFDVTFNPWEAVFSNARALNRITNFKLMRANLKIKVVINGNGFQYGRAICAYHPYHGNDTLTPVSTLVSANMIHVSQLPHIYLDPCTSTGGEMSIPFFWHHNYCDVVLKEWENLGRIYIQPLNMLKHANGASDKVTITVFAWAEDVQLSGLTSIDSTSLSPQSGHEVDQANRKGIVSGPATAIARAATALSVIPEIAPFAMATASAANGVAGAAKAFGFSRPAHTVDNMPVRPTTVSSLANTTVPDSTNKLTLDDKQELTVDPRISGLGGHDAMSINSIASRESYLTKFTWAMNTPETSLLWNTRVTPVLWDVTDTNLYHFPAVAAATLPFKYWTGTLNFRFQVVCSAFHKGRLRVVYDPNYQNDDGFYNTNYAEIVDIADKNDFTISISNSQSRTLLEYRKPGLTAVSELYSTTRYLVSDAGNGTLSVEVLNELTTPNDTVNNDVEINVFVSAGDDFEVFVPDSWFQNFNFGGTASEELEVQSGTEQAIDAHNTAEPSAPLQEESDNIAVSERSSPLINKVFTGESITSFRQVLKRYNRHQRLGGFDFNKYRVVYNTHIIPIFRGYYNTAPYSTGAGDGYGYVNTVMIHYVMSMFQGWRGSIRRKFMVNNEHRIGGDNHTGHWAIAERHQHPSPFNFYFYNFQVLADPANSADSAAQIMPIFINPDAENVFGTSGAAYQNFDMNPALEVESPYYDESRFTPGKRLHYTTMYGGEHLRYVANISCSPTTQIDIWTAAGEDFQCYFFTGLPPMRYETGPPAT
jgi:hypothetical protein